MPTKRATAKMEAAELVDLASRLAPFFPPPAAELVAHGDDDAEPGAQDHG